jgi:hypothetical protein
MAWIRFASETQIEASVMDYEEGNLKFRRIHLLQAWKGVSYFGLNSEAMCLTSVLERTEHIQ